MPDDLQPLTAEEIAALALCEAASPGPWKVEDPLGPDIVSIVADGPDGEVYDWRHVAQIGFDPEPLDSSDIGRAEADVERLRDGLRLLSEHWKKCAQTALAIAALGLEAHQFAAASRHSLAAETYAGCARELDKLLGKDGTP